MFQFGSEPPIYSNIDFYIVIYKIKLEPNQISNVIFVLLTSRLSVFDRIKGWFTRQVLHPYFFQTLKKYSCSFARVCHVYRFVRYHLAAWYYNSSVILFGILQRNPTSGCNCGNKEFESSQEIVPAWLKSTTNPLIDNLFEVVFCPESPRTWIRTQHLPETEVSRKCFEKLSPYGHGMMCSFMAIFSSLFAISAHSEAGGACMSNQNSFRASLLCSLVCSVSSSFGAYLRKRFKNIEKLKCIWILKFQMKYSDFSRNTL